MRALLKAPAQGKYRPLPNHTAPPMIDWNAIETVLLDMDGTLLDLHFDNYFWGEHLPRRFADIHRRDHAEVTKELADRFARERGTLNWYCTEFWSRQLQVDIPALKREIAHMIAVRPHVTEFLERLHEGPRQILLVTNAHHQSLHLKLSHTGIDRWFHHIVVSHDFRSPKEDPRFWQQLRSTHPFDPATTLLIDDTASVLRSAQQFGIRHLLTLLQPDSKQAARLDTEFPGILHFDEIMPDLETP